ncbi:uncharacterized protein LOC144463450 [Epinephelus lanceolatus]
MTTRANDGDEVTCVPGWTLPLLWEPPAMRRRRKQKRGPVFWMFSPMSAQRGREREERHRPTFLLLVLPLFHIRERTRCMMSHCTEATTSVVGLWSVFLPRLQDSSDDCERKENGT